MLWATSPACPGRFALKGLAFLSALLWFGAGTGELKAQEPWGQGRLRPSLAGASAAASRLHPFSNEPYNLSLGPARFRLNAAIMTEFNDNVNLAEEGRISSMIVEPRLNFQGSWHISNLNELHLNVGLGYRYYSDSEYNRGDRGSFLQIAPGSSLSFDIFVADSVRITLHESFFQSSDPTEQATISNVTSSYSRFENTAGISAVWDLNSVVLRSSYDHFNYISLTDAYDYLDHASEIFHSSVTYFVSDWTKVGFEGSASWTDFSDTYQNDSLFTTIGPFLERRITPLTTLRMGAGYQQGSFSSGGGNGDSSEVSGYYFNATLVNQLHHYCTQTLATGHEAQLGFRSNYEEVDYIRYSMFFTALREFPINLYTFYEQVSESGDNQPENLQRIGAGIHVAHRFGKQTTAAFDYNFLVKDSDLARRGYRQNRVALTLTYQF